MEETGFRISSIAHPTEYFYFDKSVGRRGVENVQTNHNENRTELVTFGKHPFVYYAGQTDYVSFSLSGTFIDEEEMTCREQVDRLKEILNEREYILVENSQGQKRLCDVTMTSESSPQLHHLGESLNYITVSVNCVEIEDYVEPTEPI